MAKQTSARKPSTRPPARAPQITPRLSTPSHEQIARRAFELYQARGAEHGSDLGDWLLAESQLLSAQA